MNPEIAISLCFEYFHNWTIMLKAVRLYANGDIGYRIGASSRRTLTLNDGFLKFRANSRLSLKLLFGVSIF
jgi:hypothetical protein